MWQNFRQSISIIDLVELICQTNIFVDFGHLPIFDYKCPLTDKNKQYSQMSEVENLIRQGFLVEKDMWTKYLKCKNEFTNWCEKNSYWWYTTELIDDF